MAPPSRSESAVEALTVNQPTKLFIGGITKSTTTKQLRDHFQQHGRVLDCIAMRQPDGRSRGFGYVTLDCRAAAEKCLVIPQVVDNRILDVKMAVPEGVSVPSAPTTPMSASSPSFMPGAFGALGNWGNAYHGATAFGVDSMSLGYPASSLDSLQALSSFDRLKVFDDSDLAAPSMHAKPMLVRSMLLENNRDAVSKVATGKARRGLGDITNKTRNPSMGEKKLVSASDPQMEGGYIMSNKNANLDTEETSADTAVQLTKMTPPSVAVATKDYPSVGSALHASGECHRCNFFSKGRCASGSDCSFCHFEHVKRKVNRQEKRERREKWLMHQTAQEESTARSESERSESQNSLQSESLQRAQAKRLDGSAAPPGLSPVNPAANLGESTPSKMLLVPPGAFWPRIPATSPSTSSSCFRPPPLQLLSTTPSPLPTPLANGKCASPALSAANGVEHALAGPPGLVTVATQTEPEPCELCGQHTAHAQCEPTIAPERCLGSDEAKSSWSKEELLRLRCRKSTTTRRIRTHPTDELSAF